MCVIIVQVLIIQYYILHVVNGKQSRKRKNAMHFCRHSVLIIILSYLGRFCSFAAQRCYVPCKSNSPRWRLKAVISVKVLTGRLNHADHLRLHAKLVKAVLLRIDSVIAGPIEAMGKTGRHRLSCRDGSGFPIGRHKLYYCIYCNTKRFA